MIKMQLMHFFFLFGPLPSLGKMCPWLQVWPLCPNETPTKRRQALNSTPQCLEDKIRPLPSGGTSWITQGCV